MSLPGKSDRRGLDSVPASASARGTTPFDFIVVGSGAGGAPLAARLAKAGKRVLVLEAGEDPGARAPDGGWESQEQRDAAENERPVFHCPGLNAASTEPELYQSTGEEDEMSWHFGVRHYKDGHTQGQDPKADKKSGEVFYPRCASLGGCTSHNAMVTIYGTDSDWQRIADLTGDPSWEPDKMRGYFKRLERARYTRRRLTLLGRFVRWFYNWLNPKRQAASGHGLSGWLDITTIDPKTAVKDPQMLRAICDAVEIAEMSALGSAWRWIKRTLRGRLYQDLDPNDKRTIRDSPEGLSLVPLACGLGRRGGPREFLLDTRSELSDGDAGSGELKIATGVFVKRVVFEKGNKTPQAVGVEFATGRHLYGASRPDQAQPDGESRFCYVREGGEVILCGGAFNSPQLLMLSGIGEEKHLEEARISGPADEKGVPVAARIDLPGVGRNLRDRYEVSVITEMKEDFAVLDGVSFDPDDPADTARREWETLRGPERERTGLYATSGASIAVMKKSRADLPQPDLFLFGVPAAFRGYFPSWSKQLLRRNPDFAGSDGDSSTPQSRNLWSWIILKAYSNNKGTVRLQSPSPFETPKIDFNYFADGTPEEQKNSEADMQAVLEGVAYARRLNTGMKKSMIDHNPEQAEVEPGWDISDDSDSLREWIKSRTWGHHACGTCRIGRDMWKENVAELTDREAVLDSKFRVHGVSGLRVVDASVFPEIPGYFIVTPTYMISEKASDTLLEGEELYPARLRSAEAAAVRSRRKMAPSTRRKAEEDKDGSDQLPSDTVGFAFSGGGIRSATFCLGILQGLAKRARLRDIDFLSTISGGGYTGSFLGRLFTRQESSTAESPVDVVERTVRDSASAPLRWLRSTANYVAGAGGKDAWQNYGIYLRNLLTLYMVLAYVGLAAFGALRWIGDRLPFGLGTPPAFIASEGALAGVVSPWWWLPAAVLVLGVLPLALAYWLAPKPGTSGLLNFIPAAAWVALVAGMAFVATLPDGTVLALGIAGVLIVAAIWSGIARPNSPEVAESSSVGAVMRNRLSLWVGGALIAFLMAVGWVLLDSAGRACASGVLFGILTGIAAAVMPFLPFVRSLVGRLAQSKAEGAKSAKSGGLTVALIAFPLAALLLVVLDAGVHKLYGIGWGGVITLLAIVLCWILGYAIDFVNSSSLQTAYGARIARTFLGASNPERIYGGQEARTGDVRLVHPDDDIPFEAYHPEHHGGPLHLVGVCINETIDAASERDTPDEKGLLMTLGPCGLSAGRYHATWAKPEKRLPFRLRLNHLLNGEYPDENARTAADGIHIPGNAFHVLRGKGDAPVPVEPLSLKTWIAISGAAFTTGAGRQTSSALAFLCGLANVRLGYWWDTRLEASDRPGRFRENILRRLKRLPAMITRMQSLLLAEFRGRFPGPGHRYWYLSDGGHFDVTGIYELLRRRLPLIVGIDGGAGQLEDAAELLRQARIDFGIEIDFLEPDDNAKGWKRFGGVEAVGPLVESWFQPEVFGTLDQLGHKEGKRAVLARVTYPGGSSTDKSWLVILKPTVTGDEPVDIRSYATDNPTFPRQSTSDQFFDEAQWESHRKLGELTALEALKGDGDSD